MPTVDERYQAKLRARAEGAPSKTYPSGPKADGAPYDLRTVEGRYQAKLAARSKPAEPEPEKAKADKPAEPEPEKRSRGR